MPSQDALIHQLLHDAIPDGNGHPVRPVSPEEVARLMRRARGEPEAIIRELIETRAQRDRFEKNCTKAAEAAGKLEELLKELTTGNASHCHLEALHQTPQGFRAVCRQGAQVREMSLHPEIDADDLKQLQPWEYVRVNEQVVVGTWAGDDYLYESSFGEVVTFIEYADDEFRLARVTRVGHGEEVVMLAEPLRDQTLQPQAKLVLLRDNPRWAIACVPASQIRSRFEVPIDSIETRLTDLACVEPLAEKLMLEIVKRIVSPEIRREYDLDPLRGLLLSSYRPGMGKTAFMRAFAHWLHELGQQRGFDVVLYLVKPNEFKSMWHGEDARIVREDLFGSIRGRREVPRSRPLVQLLVLDEIDSLGRRPEGRDVMVSSAQSDALEAFLVEMDGMVQEVQPEVPAHLLVVGMTNRPDRIDDAIKRPGRMGDEVLEIPDLDIDGAEQVCLVYARSREIPWFVDGTAQSGLDLMQVAERLIRPALAVVFPAVVLRYSTETQRKTDVTAGQVLASVHYRKAMSLAKNRAAERRLYGIGVAAVGYDDVVEGLLDTALSVAAQMEADPHMLIRHLKIKTPVVRVDVTPREELEDHRYQTTSTG